MLFGSLVAEAEHDPVCLLAEAGAGGAEQARHMGKARQRLTQGRFKAGLGEGIAARIAVFAIPGFDLGEAHALGGVVVGAIVERDILQHGIDRAGRLQGAQRFVVDRDSARRLHGGRIALDQHRANAHGAEQIGQRQPGRPATQYRYVIIHLSAHPCLPRVRRRSRTRSGECQQYSR